MGTIKAELKRHGVTLLEMSEKLEITRPTLDRYIQQYESKGGIKKARFQKLFDDLFSRPLSTEEFLNVINTWGKGLANSQELPELSNSVLNSKKNTVYEYFLSYSHKAGIERGSISLTEKISSMGIINELENYITNTYGLTNVKIISFSLLNIETIPDNLVREFNLLD